MLIIPRVEVLCKKSDWNQGSELPETSRARAEKWGPMTFFVETRITLIGREAWERSWLIFWWSRDRRCRTTGGSSDQMKTLLTRTLRLEPHKKRNGWERTFQQQFSLINNKLYKSYQILSKFYSSRLWKGRRHPVVSPPYPFPAMNCKEKERDREKKMWLKCFIRDSNFRERIYRTRNETLQC